MLIVFVCLGSVSYVAYGATYNFYFNNTEQGPNSTASPSLTVTDGKATSTGADKTNVPTPAPASETLAPAPSPTATTTTSAQVSALAPEADGPRKRKWRIAALGHAQDRDNAFDMSYSKLGSGVSVGFFPIRELGLSLTAGATRIEKNPEAFALAELDFIPIHIALGSWENAIEGGVIGGFNTIRRVNGNAGSLHAGARVGINFSESFGLTASYRLNAGLRMAEAGIVIRI